MASEVNIFKDADQINYFFLMILLYCLASLPLVYVFSFGPKSELIGFILFFILNVVACFSDMIFYFIVLFSQAQLTDAKSLTTLSQVMLNLRWIVVVLFPSVNFKHILFNIRLKSSEDCIAAVNALMFTSYSYNESWMSTHQPGLGIYFIIFCIQIVIWWLILILIENKGEINLRCRRCCKRDEELKREDNANLSTAKNFEAIDHYNPESSTSSFSVNHWNDSVGNTKEHALVYLDEDTLSYCYCCCCSRRALASRPGCAR
jgi:hypothetical protein